MLRLLGFQLLFILAVHRGVWSLPGEGSWHEEVSALKAFKQAISDDPRSVLSDWNNLDGFGYCLWNGVICSDQRRVLSINLSASSLKGFLAPELGKLADLKVLVLDYNSFSGPIPTQIGMLRSLTLLDLSVNRLSGSIPREVGNLTSIMKLYLHSNELTGDIPPELGKLMNLTQLRLDRNQLHGSIPGRNGSTISPSVTVMFASDSSGTGFCNLQQVKVANFSYNFLVGNIPSCLQSLPQSSFEGNCFQGRVSIWQRPAQECSSTGNQGEANKILNEPSGVSNHKKAGQPKWLLVLEIVTGALVAVILIACIVPAVRRCKPKSIVIIPWKRNLDRRDQRVISVDSELLKNVVRISRHDLEVACEDFSNIIGASSDSKVYKGTMRDGPEIAVISLCISEDLWTTYFEHYFQAEVAVLARLNHENIAKLLGYCAESDPFSRMLVFEYASNGTLYEHLHYGEERQFSWLRRMKIAKGIAHGLRYLHDELQPPFTITELNSNLVYLTEDFSPKLVDFERWKTIVSTSENSGYILNGDSYNGYMRSLERLHLHVQANTYAFGVLLLELISGRPSYCEDRGYLVDWAKEYLQDSEAIGKLVDPKMKDAKQEDLSVVCSVVSLCIEPEACKRPSMQILCAMLEDGIDTSAIAALKEASLAWAQLELTL